ncbi:MAG: hypothetical protein V3U64_02550 [Cocleimonas sp.]
MFKSFRVAVLLLAVFITDHTTALENSLADAKIQVQGTEIEILFAPGTGNGALALSRDQIVQWIEKGANAVANYYQGFPVSKLNITINPRAGGGIGGQAFNGEQPMILITLGRRANLAKLQKDWVLVHELVHLAFPSLHKKHYWMQEGLSTYIEPIVRVRAGLMSEKEAWYWMLTGMPKGLPKYGDRGLDNTNTWGRRYWGGAMFALLADQRIRAQSKNRYGIDQALRGIVKAGYSMQSDDVWPLDKILKIGDKATRTTALMTLYNEMKDKPVDVDLQAMWKRLGVSMQGKRISFDESAPQAKLRHDLIFGR